ncbi:MAG: hypothetical protein IKK28_14015 [Mogibacterium sp.]|nr:hypothetical protein [Mogibacterium sp.]
MKYIVTYIVIVNIVAFCMYGIDKSAAIKWYYTVTVPAMLIIQIAAAVWLLKRS